MCVRREALEVEFHVFVEQFSVRKQLRECPKLGMRGQMAVDEKERCLYESGFFGQFVDWDTPVTKDALFTVNERDVTEAGAGVPVSGVQRDQAGVVTQFRDVDGKFTFAAFDYRQRDAPAVPLHFNIVAHGDFAVFGRENKRNSQNGQPNSIRERIWQLECRSGFEALPKNLFRRVAENTAAGAEFDTGITERPTLSRRETLQCASRSQ